MADTFNNYFNNIVKNLLTVTNKNFPNEITNGFNLNLLDLVEPAILIKIQESSELKCY